MSRRLLEELGSSAHREIVMDVVDVRKRFGGIHAVRDVSLRLPVGAVYGVIGPNGSGKTTLINLLSGAHRPDGGSIRVSGVDTTRLPAHAIAALGVARTFQNPRVFTTLTVRQNLLLPGGHRAERDRARGLTDEVDRWLELTGLAKHADRVAHELSGGQRKLVEFARAMVHRPRAVLMDEPFAGVHPHVKQRLHACIGDAARGGTAFLIVSHEVPDLVRLSDHFVCLASGELMATGSPAEVCADPRVVDAYLGAPFEGVA